MNKIFDKASKRKRVENPIALLGDWESKQASRDVGAKTTDTLLEDSEDSEEIDKKSKIKVTDDMFEAAKLMKNGVAKI